MQPFPTIRPAGRSRLRRALFAGLIGLGMLIALLPSAVLGVGDALDVHRALPDRDARTGSVAPTSIQRAIVADLRADVDWNRYGTPHSLLRYGGSLATGVQGASAPAAARSWLSSRKALFRLTSTGTSSLEFVNDSPIGGRGHAVVFRQLFGGLPAGEDGLITVALTGTSAAGWKVVYVSSTSAGTQAAPVAPTLTAREAWRTAALDVGHAVALDRITKNGTDDSWTLLDVPGFSHPQRARLVAMPRPGATVRPAYETIVLDVDGGRADAYTVFVDAVNGNVLRRVNREQQLADTVPEQTPAAYALPTGSFFSGSYPASGCGLPHGPYAAPAGTQSIDIAVHALTGGDIVVNLHYQSPSNPPVASSDTLATPEALNYGPPVPTGDYYITVCAFEDDPGDFYEGFIAINDAVAPGEFPYPPKWKYFRSNPNLDLTENDVRRTGCWVTQVDGTEVPGCDFAVFNLASRAPWDHIVRTGAPSFTTSGNNAITGEAWLSPLTPAEQYRPVALDREYDFPWTDQWNDDSCSTTTFASPQRNDIDAAVVSLFANHNRMHDWSYHLGFTEANYNMQESNFGNTAPGPFPYGREGDPEIGNAQAGAISGGPPSYLGRDNANQITLNDGIPGITNMYLWQPIAAAFYAACTDGDYDMSIIAHEYGHAIQNRMAAGPDAGFTGHQARAMGESFSDLTAVEYLHEFNYYNDMTSVPAGLNRFAVGPYATGSLSRGIRNYGMNQSPLNFSDLEYDPNGVTSPHADGEIWSATNYDIRQAFIGRYGAGTSVTQRRCGNGEIPADLCPGNYRWAYLFHQSFLLMPSGVTMDGARDAYLAADQLLADDPTLDWSSNASLLWKAFAKRGLGECFGAPGELCRDAQSVSTEDRDPSISFQSPLLTQTQHARVRFVANAPASEGGAAITKARIYVGDYEARVVPFADTDSSTPLSNTGLMVAGTYQFLAVAPGYGHVRFSKTVNAGTTLNRIVITMPRNWASGLGPDGVAGADDADATAVATTDDGINRSKLIDESEATNWRANGVPNANNSAVTVNLAGSATRTVDRVRVSAFLRPQNTEDPGDPEDLGDVGDTDPQSRFSALRQFAIETCVAATDNASCTTDVGFVRIYTSIASAFPATAPRPVAPDLNIREFDVPNTSATHVRLVALTNQCTGGPAYQGEQDADPLNVTDCQIGSTQDQRVRAAELQVFSGPATATVIMDPVVAMTMTGPATAAAGSNATYSISYTNLGPAASSNARIVDTLPAGTDLVSASNGGTYDSNSHQVTWDLGTVAVDGTGARSVTVKVKTSTAPLTVLLNSAEFIAPLTVASPAAVTTLVTAAP